MTVFEVMLSKADMKFNCAHFICFKGFRERLHGHNYSMSVKATGNAIASDGYLIDFGDIKKAARDLCKSLNENFICPMLSDAMTITTSSDGLNTCLDCEDGSHFSFPNKDCKHLPLIHSSAEELTHYLWFRLVERLGVEALISRGIIALEITLAEAPGQAAIYRRNIPDDQEQLKAAELEVIIRRPVKCTGQDGNS